MTDDQVARVAAGLTRAQRAALVGARTKWPRCPDPDTLFVYRAKNAAVQSLIDAGLGFVVVRGVILTPLANRDPAP